MSRTDACHDVRSYPGWPVVEYVFVRKVAMVLIDDYVLLECRQEVLFQAHGGIHSRPAHFDQVFLVDSCSERHSVARAWIDHNTGRADGRFRWSRWAGEIHVGPVSAKHGEIESHRFGFGLRVGGKR